MTRILPRRAVSAPECATPAQRWTAERIARLVEDAARGTPATIGTGATVRLHGGAARIDLDLVVDHGTHLAAAAQTVRRRVAARIEACTGLAVEAVTVTVVDLRLPDQAPTTPPSTSRRVRPDGDLSGRPMAGG
ncbi:Asp23/Gls24 family envelope stress response protein [Micromonospora sp. NPDC007271]|uniref:Asp23/Gls24 family envelope stress response protein n=1 Tax=Micromonospora sp. NPDC007271 TaxID=3154587 RepID=UPI0033EE4934